MRFGIIERNRLSVIFNRARGNPGILRLGFALVIALLALSTIETYKIQQAQSRQAMEIYRHHLDQDAVLYKLRRTLWLASVHVRDYLIHPTELTWKRFEKQAAETRGAAENLQREFDRLAVGHESTEQLRAHLAALWMTMDRSREMGALPAERRQQFVEEQVVPRRNAAGNALREFVEVAHGALRANEASFEANQRDASRRLLILLTCSVLLGLAVAGFSIRYSESLAVAKQKEHEAVASAREELKLLTARLMSIQEHERTRLSRELHDEIGQALATMRLEVVRTETVCRERLPEVLDRLSRARQLAERSVRTVRNMSSMLRPSVLDDLGLGPALRSLADDFPVRTGVPCRISMPEDEPQVLEATATCVYRVVQEALHNCEKHAGASCVAISLTWDATSLEAVIVDDGIGFDAEGSRLNDRVRLGILGMKERASAIGGTLEVTSATHRGTSVRLRVPHGAQGGKRTRVAVEKVML